MRYLYFILMGLGAMAQEGFEPGPDREQGELLARGLRVGGWFDVVYRDREQEEDGLDLTHLYLYLDAYLGASWRGKIEVSRVDTPPLNPFRNGAETEIERAYLEYKHGLPFKLRMGKFNTPAGLWKQMRWAVTVDTTRKPMIEEMRFIPDQSTGVMALGKKMNGAHEWTYEFFMARGEEATSLPGRDRESRLDYGGDLSVALYERYRMGFFFADFLNDLKGADIVPGDRKAWLAYADLPLVAHRLSFRGEYLYLERKDRVSLRGYYAKLKWNFDPGFYCNYRFDQGDDLSLGDPRDHRIHTLTLSYRPLSWLRTRAEFANHRLKRYEPARYNEWSFWLGVHF